MNSTENYVSKSCTCDLVRRHGEASVISQLHVACRLPAVGSQKNVNATADQEGNGRVEVDKDDNTEEDAENKEV